MLKKYKNEIFNLIKTKGFDLANFDWEQKSASDAILTLLVDKSSTMGFSFIGDIDNYDIFKYQYSIFAPRIRKSDTLPSDKFLKWSGIKDVFTSWLDNDYKEYVN